MKLSTPEEMESVDEPPEGDNPATGERIVELNGEEMPVSDAVEYLGGWATSINSDQSNFHERLDVLEERLVDLQQENQDLEAYIEDLSQILVWVAQERSISQERLAELFRAVGRGDEIQFGGGRR